MTPVPLSTFYVVGEPGRPSRCASTPTCGGRDRALRIRDLARTALFERLISISGIGPKLALSVLSGIETPDLVRAIKAQDVARLTAIPGVGKKTAERIGLELKDRMPQSMQAAADTLKPPAPEDQLRDDLLSALVNLGYQRVAAEKAIDRELQKAPDAPFEDALRAVLRALMK